MATKNTKKTAAKKSTKATKPKAERKSTVERKTKDIETEHAGKMREGTFKHRVYELLTRKVPLTREQMMADLIERFPNKREQALWITLNFLINVGFPRLGMKVGRDDAGRYNVAIEGRSTTRIRESGSSQWGWKPSETSAKKPKKASKKKTAKKAQPKKKAAAKKETKPVVRKRIVDLDSETEDGAGKATKPAKAPRVRKAKSAAPVETVEAPAVETAAA